MDNNEDQTTTNEEDVLDEIFVDKNIPADKKLLVEILKPFVTIDQEGNLSFTENYDKLTNQKKALVYLLSKKARVLKGMNIPESSGPAEVSKCALISSQDAYNALCTTYKKILLKDSQGYTVPNHNMKKVKEVIFDKKNG